MRSKFFVSLTFIAYAALQGVKAQDENADDGQQADENAVTLLGAEGDDGTLQDTPEEEPTILDIVLTDLYTQQTLLPEFGDLVSDSSITVGGLIAAIVSLQQASDAQLK